MNPRPIPVINVRGSPREMGQQQGEAARAQIQRSLTRYREVFPQALRMTWAEGQLEARKFLPYGESAFPPFVEELRGIAAGADVPFAEVWTLNCYEGVIESRDQVWGCTCVAVRDDLTANGHVLLGHNEDWNSVDQDTVYLVRAEPADQPAFIGITYGPLLVNIGLNEAGIGVAINAVHPADGRVGVPRVLSSRAVLNTRTIGAAIRACVPKLRGGGYSYLLADPAGELYSVETSATAHDILYGEEGWLVHTNHYLAARMQALEEPGTYTSSHVRLNRARRLLKAQLGHVTVPSLQVLLQDHVNYPRSICLHQDPADPLHERTHTLASAVMDLSERILWVAPGPPCEGEYVMYQLDGES
ncbi:MAG: C45 family peptidase [Chloroflexi bacterium]|nr:C45 family peptidase [Chloroflexota bacterium]MBU1752168.1 C45 family peptidase [Chloroflexota bacterium]